MTQVVARLVGDHFEKWWPDISAQLDTIQPMWERWWTKEALVNGVYSGWIQCWASVVDETAEIIVFTTIGEYPAGKVLITNLCFGRDIDNHIDIIDATLENFARDSGCYLQEVRGRPGWKPRLKKLGYEFQQIMMFKAIPPTRRH